MQNRNNIVNKREALKELQTIPSVGKSIAEDFWNIGIRKISDLSSRSPTKLYKKLNQFSGVKNDVCILYTFRCAVYYATETDHELEKLKWWYWKDKSYID